MDDLVIRRMFVVPSFEIHGGVSGLFDLGPPGCGLKGNVVSLWKQHFVLAEGMLEMECTNLTPENVLQTSGTYVDTYASGVVSDAVCLGLFGFVRAWYGGRLLALFRSTGIVLPHLV